MEFQGGPSVMPYRFNNARGAVTCPLCSIIIIENITPSEYNEIYGGKKDLCSSCKEKPMKNCPECGDLMRQVCDPETKECKWECQGCGHEEK
jgi:hypothetical protein